MKKVTLGILFLCIAAMLLVAGCSPQGQDNGADTGMIKVGFMGPLSGDAASYGESILRGVQLAVEDVGLENVELIIEDSKCSAKDAVTAVNKLISVDGVVAIVGEVCSSATLAAMPVAAQHKVVMVSPSSTSPDISSSAWVLRTVPSDALQGAFGAQLVADKGFSKLAVLHGNEDYGIGFRNVLQEEFPKTGGDVVAAESFLAGSTDLRAQLTKIKQADADALYIISNSPDSAISALKQAAELGLEVALFGSEGLKSSDILEGAGSAAEGLTVTAVSVGSAEFVEKHVAKYGEEPGPFAAQGYDAYKAISLALEQGATSSEAVAQALLGVEFSGAQGTLNFDANGDIKGNYDVLTVQNGEFTK